MILSIICQPSYLFVFVSASLKSLEKKIKTQNKTKQKHKSNPNRLWIYITMEKGKWIKINLKKANICIDLPITITIKKQCLDVLRNRSFAFQYIKNFGPKFNVVVIKALSPEIYNIAWFASSTFLPILDSNFIRFTVHNTDQC